LIRSK